MQSRARTRGAVGDARWPPAELAEFGHVNAGELIWERLRGQRIAPGTRSTCRHDNNLQMGVRNMCTCKSEACRY
jgi:hypothetical protein